MAGNGKQREARTGRFITYSPETESHRAAYAQVAEGLILLDKAHRDNVLGACDVTPNGWVGEEPEPHILWEAREAHLRALFETLLTLYGDDFMRTLYVELRLYVDEQQRSLSAGVYQYRRKGGER